MSAYYASPELPWAPIEDEDRRFRRIVLAMVAAALLLGVAVPLVSVPPLERSAAPELPPRLAKLVIERKLTPPPPPPPPKEEPKPEQLKPEAKPVPKPVERPKPEPQATPEPARQAARERAQNAGVLAFRSALSELREDSSLDKLKQERLSTGGETAVKTERALIASKVGKGSGGIDASRLSRDTAGGGGALAGRATTQVESRVGGAAAEAAPRPAGKKAGRTDEQIQLVFDRNKSAIYALYNRALRSNPALQGKVVLRLTISPSGEVTAVDVVSSELGDAELERKIALRVKRFDFGAKDVSPVTVSYPIEFFPS